MKTKKQALGFLPHLLCLLLAAAAPRYAATQTPLFSSLISIQKDRHQIKAFIYPTRPDKLKPHKNRYYHYYYQHDIHQNQGGFTGYLLHGKYEVTNDLQQLIQQGEFKNGVKSGVWKEWQGNGTLSAVSHWKNGRQHGKLEIYDSNGRLANVQQYRRGKTKGEMTLYQNGEKIEPPKKEKAEKTKKGKQKKGKKTEKKKNAL